MSTLSDFEDRMARAFEGLFAGAFRSPVQPAEVAKALAHAMDDERMVGVGKVYAPVAYTVALSPPDADNMRGFVTVLEGELATYLVDHARERGYHLATKPVVELYEDDALKIGRFNVSAEHSFGEEPPSRAPETGLPPDAETPAAQVLTDTITVGETGHDVLLRGDRAVIGRLSTCDICLKDANVSRRHAELMRVDDAWYVQDLESTNGTRLNGAAVDRARLRDGDVVEVGVTRLTYHRAGE
jgi:predicted component of type VI protein secretion system